MEVWRWFLMPEMHIDNSTKEMIVDAINSVARVDSELFKLHDCALHSGRQARGRGTEGMADRTNSVANSRSAKSA